MLKLAVLVSGGGTNLQAIMDAIADGRITNAGIEAVISNNRNAYALQRARKAGIPAYCITPNDYESREAFHDALLAALERYAPLPDYPPEFGARVFKIARDSQGARLAYLKVTGGTLRVKDPLTNLRPGLPEDRIWDEKVDQSASTPA